MPNAFCDLIELRLGSAGLEGTLALPATIRPLPGQYLFAFAAGQSEALAVPLFPAGPASDLLRVAPPLPTSWAAGMRLQVRGPLGSGFRLPPGARRVALAPLGCGPERLLPLAYQALEQDAAVALFSAAIPNGLPSAVEIAPAEQMSDVLEWADYLALDLATGWLARWKSAAGLREGQKLPFSGQALVRAPVACGGLGECGVCAVRTRSGWSLACKDGPVYDLANLEG
jgi:dihydroorotate dehydrogenase electron transfer subunit